jgi:hypothetical protein
MHRVSLLAFAAFVSLCGTLHAADRMTVTLHNDSRIARADETIAIPFTQVQRLLPNLAFDQVIVRDAKGNPVPSQVTALRHVHRGPPQYDDLIFQHSFAAGEQRAIFTLEASPTPQPPFASRVWAGHVPERHDDFAWENDVSAHRAYGPALELPSAAPDQMTSSGLDLWTKKVPYRVMDRWYRKGHDGLHSDTGEGLDFYEVGTNRGVGGTGVWDGQTLRTSRNWRRSHVYANGPIRAIFELSYEPWDGGDGVQVRETKRFHVDAAQHLDEIHSTFNFKPAAGSDGTLTIAIGLTEHPSRADITIQRDENGRWISLWEKYKDTGYDELGTAVLLAPEARFAGFARSQTQGNGRPDDLLLVKVKPGETIRYFAGGAWKPAGHFASAAQWTGYVGAKAARLAAPVRVELAPTAPAR